MDESKSEQLVNLHQQQITNEEEQAVKAGCRERFLQVLNWLPDKPAHLRMFGSTMVKGTIKAVSVNSENFLVNKLQTPMGQLDHAALRVRDIVYIEIPYDMHAVEPTIRRQIEQQTKGNERDIEQQDENVKMQEESGSTDFESFDEGDETMHMVDNDYQQKTMDLEQQKDVLEIVVQTQKVDDEGFEEQQQEMDVGESVDNSNDQVKTEQTISEMNEQTEDTATHMEKKDIEQNCGADMSNVHEAKGEFLEKLNFTADQFFNQFS